MLRDLAQPSSILPAAQSAGLREVEGIVDLAAGLVAVLWPAKAAVAKSDWDMELKLPGLVPPREPERAQRTIN
ncbi:hypothetical protein D3C83_190690 [compost metagenome]